MGDPYRSEQDLLAHASTLTGRSVTWLLEQMTSSLSKPASQAYEGIDRAAPALSKGAIGQALDRWLCCAPPRGARPDFPELGVEVKSLSLSSLGIPRQSVFVTYAPLIPKPFEYWEGSAVYLKLKRVLWIPIGAPCLQNLNSALFLQPFLWTPSSEQFRVLKQDWEELTELLIYGDPEHISASQGQYLQLRPKGQNKRSLAKAYDSVGQVIYAQPKAFYLRRSAVSILLSQCLSPLLSRVGADSRS